MGVCCSRVRPDVAAVPPSERITAEWLTSALRSELPDGARVASLSVVDIAAKAEDGTELPNGGGLAGATVVRVAEIQYVDADGQPLATDLPTSLIHKWASSRELIQDLPMWPDRIISALMLNLNQYYGVRREVEAYSAIVAELAAAGTVRTPRCLYAAFDGPSSDTGLCCATCCPGRAVYGRSSLLFADLSGSGFTSTPVNCITYYYSQELATSCIRTLARIHAWGWGKAEGHDESAWTALLAGNWEFGHKLFKYNKALDKYLAQWCPREHAADLRDVGVQEMLYDLKANQHRWWARAISMSRDQTVLHGDFHKGNLFVRPEEDGPTEPEEVYVIDWAYVGAGHCAWEVAYFFLLSTDATPQEELALAEAYYTELSARNSDLQYSREEFLADLKMVQIMQAMFVIMEGSQPRKPAEYDENLAKGGADRDLALLGGETTALPTVKTRPVRKCTQLGCWLCGQTPCVGGR